MSSAVQESADPTQISVPTTKTKWQKLNNGRLEDGLIGDRVGKTNNPLLWSLLCIGKEDKIKHISAEWGFTCQYAVKTYPSIHCVPLIRDRVAVVTDWEGQPRRPSPLPQPSALPKGLSWPAGIYSPPQCVLGLPRGLLPVGCARNTSGGILIRCPNYLNWPLSMWMSDGFTLSSLTLSLWVHLIILWRRVMSASSVHDLFLLLVTAQHSSPVVRVGTSIDS